MRRLSLKVKVGVYAALLTMTALFVGVVVMMVTLYFYQISELDEDLRGDAEELVWDIKNFRDAPKDPRALLSDKFIPVDMRDYYLIIEGPEGQVLYRSANLKGEDLGGEFGKTRTTRMLGHGVRVGSWEVALYRVRVGARLNVIERFQKDLGVGFAAGLPAVGLVVFFGGLWLGRRAVAPVAELSSAAERISASNPRERLPLPAANDEIAKLTEVLNRSFDRLQSSYAVASRFSVDASHQLKTPVTILRAGLDHLSNVTDLSETGWKVVRIANTGAGLSGADRELIFERFRRGAAVGGGVRGHGLGLNIARELLRAHGGELCLNPSAPGWIEFEFRLPAAG